MPTSLNEVQSISASADGSVWAVTKSQQIYRYDASINKWLLVPGELTNIAVGTESSIWGVSADGKVWKYVNGSTPWELVPGEVPSGLVQISASFDGEVWGVSSNHQVWKYVGGTEPWQHIPASKAAYVSVGSRDNIWSLDVGMQIWRYTSSGEIPWAPAPGALVQVSTSGHVDEFGEGSTVNTWGVNSSGEVLKYDATSLQQWQTLGSGFKQIAVGSETNAWGIDTNDVAICLTPPQVVTGDGGEPWVAAQQKRWDSKDKYDQFQSTHLWIVSRAVEVARADPFFGQNIFNLVQPGVSPGQNEFHDGLCEGIWDADAADPYRNSVFGDQITATYKSHFYDPTTGKNWLRETDPTALTEAPKFFAEALNQYKNGNIRSAGYNLGLSLHYLTDMTQPMHTTNYTYLSSNPFGYHSAFETFAISVMNEVQITQPYVPSNLGNDPGRYIVAAATQARPRGAKICSLNNVNSWNNEINNYFHSWKKDVTPEIQGALIDGVAITAQYLITWMQAAQPTVPANDPRLFTQAYGGANASYWAVDSDGHLFHRLGWSFGWLLIKPPTDSPVVSLWVDGGGGIFVVTANSVWYLTSDKNWRHVYPPPLADKEKIVLDIKQLAVVEPILLWGLDKSGAAYQGEGLMPQVDWTDTSSPKLTSLSANSRDCAWGANADDKSVWEYTGGRWQNRGSGVVQISVDTKGQAWGISAAGQVVTYNGSSWQTPPFFSDTMGNLQTPGWGPLAWINARGTLLIVDRQGVAWGPTPIMVQGENPWMPLG